MLTTTSSSITTPPRIAVIGGGAAGMACARVFTRDCAESAAMNKENSNKSNGVHLQVYEKDSSVGGVWNYHKAKAHERPMYAGLRTNLPKEIMSFREFPWPKDASNDDHDCSFLTHEQVQQYLLSYQEEYGLEILCGQQVTHLRLLDQENTKSYFSPCYHSNGDEVWPQIELILMDTMSSTATCDRDDSDTQLGETQSLQMTMRRERFDAVVVANGHYNLPNIPHLPGLEQYFSGRVMHSIAYDEPNVFIGQTVLCIGARASGADIAREISVAGAKRVYLSDSTRTTGEVRMVKEDDLEQNTIHGSKGDSIKDSCLLWVPATKQVLPNGKIRFEHNCPLEPDDVDVIIFCTGYEYSFPFINNQSRLELETSDRCVRPLYQQLFHAHYPNLAFVGLPHSVVPFPFFEFQAEACWNLWNNPANGNCIPPLAQRKAMAANDFASRGEGKPAGKGQIKDTHYLGDAQWDYCRRMAKFADLYDQSINEYLNISKEIYDHVGSQRKNLPPGGPDHYREVRYERNKNGMPWRSF